MSTLKDGDDSKKVQSFADLKNLSSTTSQEDIKSIVSKYSELINSNILQLQQSDEIDTITNCMDHIHLLMLETWAVPVHGYYLGCELSAALRTSGGLDFIIKNCVKNNKKLLFSSARLLEQCLINENRLHVVEHSLEKVVHAALSCLKQGSAGSSQIGVGILKNLLKHSEQTCFDVIHLGGLDAIILECRKNDVETLRHCAVALANLSLFGGADNHEAMINRNVPLWLFPLAFHSDHLIKYYACIAIAVLVANKDIETEVLKSGTLDLVGPFVMSHNPSEFGKSDEDHQHGQTKEWLQRLIPLLKSHREEAQNLAAFHLCMEVEIKTSFGKANVFAEIDAIDSLKMVASKSNAIASKFAAQALRLLGQAIPRKLSQQVPLWSEEDVLEWIEQNGFGQFRFGFLDSCVDGDLLLRLCDDKLRDDIGMGNGIRRQCFRRELNNLKKTADYSSKDVAKISHFLKSIEPDYAIYTYPMINAGIDRDSLKNLTDIQLTEECDIKNSIHRNRILGKIESGFETNKETGEELDVFISYRRSNGSNLASLLKVYLQLNGKCVFLDVDGLKAGKFDINILKSIRQAKNFILVLTKSALDRCMGDHERKDWLHKVQICWIWFFI